MKFIVIKQKCKLVSFFVLFQEHDSEGTTINSALFLDKFNPHVSTNH